MTKILRSHESGTLKVRLDTVEDMWSLQRIIFAGDIVKSESERKFKSDEGDEGEMKKVVITLRVEKTELDKSADRLRILGKIVDGKPLEYVRLNSYHTINISPGDIVELSKTQWPDYLAQVVKNAVSESKRARAGIIVVDDEKALPAYVLGYGIAFKPEIYSGLSKRMSNKDYAEQQKKYYSKVIEVASGMSVDTVVVAGPGFTKDDIKKYAEQNGLIEKSGKRFAFFAVSNAERSGVYELIRGEEFGRILSKERIRTEFIAMEAFLSGLQSGLSKYGNDNVRACIEEGSAGTVLVNDNMLGDPTVQATLSVAERAGAKIEVFNSDDEAGEQLKAFKGIACMA